MMVPSPTGIAAPLAPARTQRRFYWRTFFVAVIMIICVHWAFEQLTRPNLPPGYNYFNSPSTHLGFIVPSDLHWHGGDWCFTKYGCSLHVFESEGDDSDNELVYNARDLRDQQYGIKRASSDTLVPFTELFPSAPPGTAEQLGMQQLSVQITKEYDYRNGQMIQVDYYSIYNPLERPSDYDLYNTVFNSIPAKGEQMNTWYKSSIDQQGLMRMTEEAPIHIPPSQRDWYYAGEYNSNPGSSTYCSPDTRHQLMHCFSVPKAVDIKTILGSVTNP